MRKILLALVLLMAAGPLAAQTYDADGALLSQARTYVFDGVDAWDRWEGQVLAQQDGAWTVAATQSGVWNVGTLTTITNPVAVTGTFFQATQPVSVASLPLPTGAATLAAQLPDGHNVTVDNVVGSPVPARLTDGTDQANVSATGKLEVTCDNCGGSTPFEDNDAFVGGTTSVVPMGALYDTTPPAITDGNAGAPRMNVNRQLLVDGSAVTQPVSAAALPLPTGAATEATLATRLAEATFTTRVPVNGQAAMAASIPVVIASNQTNVPGKILDGTASGEADVTGAAPALTDQGVFVRPIDSERSVTDTLTGNSLNDAITIDGQGASSVVVTVGTGLTGAGVLTFEGTVDGSNWTGIPIIEYLGSALLPNKFDEKLNDGFPGVQTNYKFLHPGFRSYRVRVSTIGAGSATAAINASAGTTVPFDSPPFFTGSQPFDLSLPGNSVDFTSRGASMAVVFWSSTLGASTVTPTLISGNGAVSCYALGDASQQSRISWTGAVNGIAWACPLYGATAFRLTKDGGIGAGTPTLSVFLSMAASVPSEDRPVTQWVSGSSPTTVTVGTPKALLTPEGRAAVTLDHPRSFNCATTSTATTSTVLTNCGAPGAGLTRYITGMEWSSSIISTTANFMTIQYGTGAVCGTGTTVIYRGFKAPAFASPPIDIGTTPIRIGTNTDLCFLHPGAGTRLINVRGYVAP